MKFTLSYRRSAGILLIVLLSLSTVLLASLPAAAKGPVDHPFPTSLGTTWGTSEVLGNGQIQSFVTVNADRIPQVIGVYFTENALSGLPETMSDGRWDVKDANGNVFIPCCGHETVLDLPAAGLDSPFQHFVMNWNPMGHMPAGIYDAPHFDLHFYVISNDERTAIAAATAETMCSVPNPPGVGGEHPVAVTCETFQQAMMPLDAAQMPPGYIPAGAVEPGMGNHLMNTQAPELAPALDRNTLWDLGIAVPYGYEFASPKFTHTWIYGTYAGRLTFYEPMITIAFLQEQHERVCSSIAMPEVMPESGYYPTQYCIRYTAGDNAGEGNYVVSLESFIKF